MASNIQTISSADYREVVGTVRDREQLDDVFSELNAAGFDRGDLDLLPAKFADDEVTADGGPTTVDGGFRREFVSRDDRETADVLAYGTAVGGAALIGVAIAMLSGTGAGAVAVGLIGGAAIGLLIGEVFRHKILGLSQLRQQDQALSHGGLAILARVRSSEDERRAAAIMRQHGMEKVHTHDVEIRKTADDIPLGWLVPDPWLSNRRLAE